MKQSFYEFMVDWIKREADGNLNKHLKVLDVGFYNGVLSSKLAEQDCFKVFGVDINDEAVLNARCNFSADNLLFEEGDIEVFESSNLFKGDYYDVVVAIDVFEHLRDPVTAMINIYNCLKKGGCLFLSVPSHFWLKNIVIALNPFYWERHYHPFDKHGHIRFYCENDLRHLINYLFEIKVFKHYPCFFKSQNFLVRAVKR